MLFNMILLVLLRPLLPQEMSKYSGSPALLVLSWYISIDLIKLFKHSACVLSSPSDVPGCFAVSSNSFHFQDQRAPVLTLPQLTPLWDWISDF